MSAPAPSASSADRQSQGQAQTYPGPAAYPPPPRPPPGGYPPAAPPPGYGPPPGAYAAPQPYGQGPPGPYGVPPPYGYYAPTGGAPPPYYAASGFDQPQQPLPPPPPPSRGAGPSSGGPKDISFSLLLPVQSISSRFNHDIAMISAETGTSIGLTGADDSSGTRKALRIAGLWDNALRAQRRVLDLVKATTNEMAVDVTLQTTCLVPKEQAPELVNALPRIEKDSNCSIKLFPSSGGPDARNSLVVIVSPDNNKSRELAVLEDVKRTLRIKRLPSDLPDEGSSETERVEIPVPSRFAGSVIGRGASIVRELEAESGARINLSREGTKVTTPNETLRFIIAEGTGSQVRSAFRLIMLHVSEARDKAEHDADYRVPLSVPDSLIGVIIGKGGKSLADLQQDMRVKIQIEHTGRDTLSPSICRLVEISGIGPNVERAQMAIVERLIEASAKPHPSQSSSSSSSSAALPSSHSREKRRRSRSPSHERRRPPPPARDSSLHPSYPASLPPPLPLLSSSSAVSSTSAAVRPLVPVLAAVPPLVPALAAVPAKESMTVGVPVNQVGAVIGSRGSTVRKICEDSGANVHIEGKDEIAPNATERKVTISGTTAQVALAFEMIQRALNESAEPKPRSGSVPRTHAQSVSQAPHAMALPPSHGYPPMQDPYAMGNGYAHVGYGAYPPPYPTPYGGAPGGYYAVPPDASQQQQQQQQQPPMPALDPHQLQLLAQLAQTLQQGPPPPAPSSNGSAGARYDPGF